VAATEAAAVALSDGKWTRQNAVVGTPAQVREQLQEFEALGVSYFMAEVLNITDAETRVLVDEALGTLG
jgi:alkanesulfonate monooxygenase SsuD/methylene tetrahydromethanopterin reductase-like flavin-dependent oxidoreductase (luciferase family)